MLKQGVHWRVDRAVDVAVWRAGYGAVAVVHTVWRAVKDDPAHLALQDFLYEARG